MKKIVIVLFAFVICATISTKRVFADFGSPVPLYDKVVVCNPDGTTGYNDFNFEKTFVSIPFGEILETISDERDEMLISWNGKNYYVSVYDLKPIEDEYFPKEEDKNSSINELVVIDHGARMFKGPGLIYDYVFEEEIPIGTPLTYEYSDSHPYGWIYTEYNSRKGWVHIENVNEDKTLDYIPVLAFRTNEKGFVSNNVRIYEKPRYEEKYLINLDLSNYENEVNLIYYQSQGSGGMYYVCGDSIEGWVHSNDIFFYNDNNLKIHISSEHLQIYEDPECTLLKKEILFDDDCVYIASTTGLCGWFYKVNIDGVEGFVNSDEVIIAKEYKTKHPLIIEKSKCYLYKYPEENKEYIINEIPEGYTINDYYEYYDNLRDSPEWYYFNDRNYAGWINDDETYKNVDDKYFESNEDIDINDIDINKEIIEDDVSNENLEVENKLQLLELSNTMSTVVIWAAIIVTTILCLNKGKNDDK